MMSSLIFVWLLVIERISYGALSQQIVENCDILLKKCTARMTCGLALHDYRISCKKELYGRTNTSCSEVCQLAIISLGNTDEGFDYLRCDCGDNTYCNLIRERTRICYPEVDPSIKLCRVSELYCKADSTCAEAWNYYRYLCEHTFNGIECTKRCNNSVSILMRHRAGVNIKECSCDGEDIYYKKCTTEKRNFFRLCYGIELPNDERFDTSTSSCADSSIKVHTQHEYHVHYYLFVLLCLIISI